jgi:outer membrane protein
MKKIIVILGFGLVGSGAFAQAGTGATFSFSLQQAVDYALQNQKDVKNAVIEEEIAHKKVNEIMGAGLPQINSNFDVKKFIEGPTSVVDAGNFGGPPGTYTALSFNLPYQASGGFDASQLLFSSDYFLGLKASKVFVELSTRSAQRTKIETAATVSKAYYTVLINQERTKLMDANIARLKKTMEETKAFLDNGFVEKIDYDRLTVTYNNLLVEQEKINRLLNLGTYLLKYQMGMDINAALTLTDKLEDVKLDTAKEMSAEKFDYAKRVEYNLFESQFVLSKLDLKRNKLAYLPTAVAYGGLTGTAMRNDFDMFNSATPWYPTALIGAKVTMPIFTGLRGSARTQQARLKLMQAENNLDYIKKAIDLELASSSTTLQNATLSFENQKKNIVIAEDVARVAKIKYEQGVGSNLELITAETSLKEAQTNYYSALFDAIVAKIDFDKANGNLK